MVFAMIIAGMEMLSVLAYSKLYFYPYSLSLAWVATLSVFLTSIHSVYRNTKKIQNIFNIEQKIAGDAYSVMHVVLCALTALVGFVTKSFSFLLLGFSQDSYYSFVLNRLPIVYAMYVFLNALADVKRCTDGMQGWAVGDFSNISLKVSEYGHQDLVVLFSMMLITLVTCHFKMLAVTLSMVSLVNQYGGIYQPLYLFRRFLYFPIVAVALGNSVRSYDKIKLLSKHAYDVGLWDILSLSCVFAASFTKAISSKLLVYSSWNMMPVLFFDGAVNGIRQCGDDLPCCQQVKR